MRILVAVEELRVGGAQTFALRLAQALHEAGHAVYLYSMYWQYTEHNLVKRLAPDVKIIQYHPGNKEVDTFILRTDDWLLRHGYDIAFRGKMLEKHLINVIKDKKIQVVSSNTFKCDALFARVLRNFPRVPLIVTMHGDYEQFLTFYKEQNRHIIPEYLHKLTNTIARINGVAYLSEQNLETISLNKEVAQQIELKQIYNGLEGRYSSESDLYSRKKLGISPDSLVFGMVARGVPEKGWEPVIQAYQRLREERIGPTNLVLVGASAFLEELENKYKIDDSIHFLGFIGNPVDCIQSFDVGILASSLKESLPNSIAEYLFCGMAVISTNIGEVARMILTDEGLEAGILIDFPSQGLADVEQLYQAMRQYSVDGALLQTHQRLAPQAFAKFDMSRCIASYASLYERQIKVLAE